AGAPRFLLETPGAAARPVAERVAAAVADSGLPTATGYHWRHLDTVERARAALTSRAVRLVDARWWGGPPPAARWRAAQRPGGGVVERAPPVLALVRVLGGEVAEVIGGAAPSSA